MGIRVLTSDTKFGDDDNQDTQDRVVQRSDNTESTDLRPEARSTYLCRDY